MGDSSASSRASMSYEDTWNTNEAYDSDVWDNCDPIIVSSVSPTLESSLQSEETPRESPENPREVQDDSDGTITENEETQMSSESANFETPIASQLLDCPPKDESYEELDVTEIPSNHTFDVPPGNYQLVGWSLNITGGRLIDEVCQISAYTPKEKFNLFVMPHGNPNNYMREHYGLQVFTSGPFRTMRDIITRRTLRTRSDVSALTEFISWLEKIKGTSDGVILIFHDVRKLISLKLVQSLERFGLLDRFKSVVKGFCNICTLAEGKLGETKFFSLKVLSNVLLPYRSSNRRGAIKARTCHDILVELLQGGHNSSLYASLCQKTNKRLSDIELIRQVCDNIIQHLEYQAEEQKRKGFNASEHIYKYSVTVASEEQMLNEFVELLDRQNSFRGVFKDLMNFDLPTRQIINRVRRKIVNQNYCFRDVETAWNEKKCLGLEEFFNNIENITEKEFNLITEVFERHFNPDLGSYLSKLQNEKKKKKPPTKQDVKEDLGKSFAKLPKIAEEEDDESVKGHRRVKSL